MKTEDNRVVVLIDMDCFYVQVEERENPQNKGKPACVVQYKNWKGGGIIAVNYEARAKGISRQMRGDEAKEKCPECILYRVPELRGKADLTKYRDAGKEVLDVLCEFGVCIERASIDEAYLDVTSVISEMMKKSTDTSITSEMLPNTHVVGLKKEEENRERGVNEWLNILSDGEFNEKNWKLTHAAVLCEKMRAAIFEKTGFRCSAGISSNKMLAKLACGINKPNKQTILPQESVEEFFRTFPLKKVRHLGGKLGLILREELNCITMGDVANLSENVLKHRFDAKTGSWLYSYARGVDLEAVSSRRLPKSIGCNKNFTGFAALDTREKIQHWLEELCAEVSERLEKDRVVNQRTAKLLTLTVRLDGDSRPSSYTRSIPLTPTYDHKTMAKACLSVMAKENTCKKANTWEPVVTCIGVSASKFVDAVEGKINRFFFTAKGKEKTSPTANEQMSSTIGEDTLGSIEMATANKDVTDEKVHDFSSAEELSLDEVPLRHEVQEESFAPSFDIVGSAENLVKKSGFFASKNANKTSEVSRGSVGAEKNATPEIDIFANKITQAATKGLFCLNGNGENGEPELSFITNKNNQRSLESFNYTDPGVKKSCTSALGFFASKTLPEPSCSSTANVELRRTSDDPHSSDIEEIEVNPLIKEIFPDLDEIDGNIVELLPLELQREVYRIIDLKKGKANNTKSKKFFECHLCHKSILEDEKEVHKDYHVAIELQKRDRLSCNVAEQVTDPNRKKIKKADKRPLENQKDKVAAVKRPRTIDSFFKSSS